MLCYWMTVSDRLLSLVYKSYIRQVEFFIEICISARLRTFSNPTEDDAKFAMDEVAVCIVLVCLMECKALKMLDGLVPRQQSRPPYQDLRPSCVGTLAIHPKCGRRKTKDMEREGEEIP